MAFVLKKRLCLKEDGALIDAKDINGTLYMLRGRIIWLSTLLISWISVSSYSARLECIESLRSLAPLRRAFVQHVDQDTSSSDPADLRWHNQRKLELANQIMSRRPVVFTYNEEFDAPFLEIPPLGEGHELNQHADKSVRLHDTHVTYDPIIKGRSGSAQFITPRLRTPDSRKKLLLSDTAIYELRVTFSERHASLHAALDKAREQGKDSIARGILASSVFSLRNGQRNLNLEEMATGALDTAYRGRTDEVLIQLRLQLAFEQHFDLIQAIDAVNSRERTQYLENAAPFYIPINFGRSVENRARYYGEAAIIAEEAWRALQFPRKIKRLSFRLNTHADNAGRIPAPQDTFWILISIENHTVELPIVGIPRDVMKTSPGQEGHQPMDFAQALLAKMQNKNRHPEITRGEWQIILATKNRLQAIVETSKALSSHYGWLSEKVDGFREINAEEGSTPLSELRDFQERSKQPWDRVKPMTVSDRPLFLPR